MRNIKLLIEYDGTNYSGWQIQKPEIINSKSEKIKTIQETIERTLQKILQEKVKIISSGRTDAGAHAKGQVVNFKSANKIPLSNLQFALNSLLPNDMVVKDIVEVDARFHSRFDAKKKTYCYSILNTKYSDPFLRNYSYFFPHKLDFRLMQRESKCLLGRHDFRSFQTQDKVFRDSIRTITDIKLKKEGDLLNIYISADGFLYNMARSIAGTLIELGRGRFKKGSMKRILEAKDRSLSGPVLPACGLTLLEVSYDKK
jgi:tRNA pseudouridine38-40 synthase